MAYPYLSQDVDEPYDSGWVTVPHELWDCAGASLRVWPSCGQRPHVECVQETVAVLRACCGAVTR